MIPEKGCEIHEIERRILASKNIAIMIYIISVLSVEANPMYDGCALLSSLGCELCRLNIMHARDIIILY